MTEPMRSQEPLFEMADLPKLGLAINPKEKHVYDVDLVGSALQLPIYLLEVEVLEDGSSTTSKDYDEAHHQGIESADTGSPFFEEFRWALGAARMDEKWCEETAGLGKDVPIEEVSRLLRELQAFLRREGMWRRNRAPRS